MPRRTHRSTAATHHYQLIDVCQTARRLMLWKTLKALLFSALFAFVGWTGIQAGADPTPVTVGVLMAIAVSFFLELRELEIAGFVTLVFENGDDEDEDGPDPREGD